MEALVRLVVSSCLRDMTASKQQRSNLPLRFATPHWCLNYLLLTDGRSNWEVPIWSSGSLFCPIRTHCANEVYFHIRLFFACLLLLPDLLFQRIGAWGRGAEQGGAFTQRFRASIPGVRWGTWKKMATSASLSKHLFFRGTPKERYWILCLGSEEYVIVPNTLDTFQDYLLEVWRRKIAGKGRWDSQGYFSGTVGW